MCCLTFENETYRSLKKDFPKIGKSVTCPKGKGKVIRHNVICGRLTVKLEDDSESDFHIKDVEFHQEDPQQKARKPERQDPPYRGKTGDKNRDKDTPDESGGDAEVVDEVIEADLDATEDPSLSNNNQGWEQP